MHPPREGDLPRELLMALAQKVVTDSQVPVEVYFKFTCPHCGERCLLQEPNKLYENGECFTCGKTNPIQFGGFSLHFSVGTEDQQN